jgi:hypothetical protein
MTSDQNAAIIETARQLLAQLAEARIPGVTDVVVEMHAVDLGERIGQIAGLALLVGAPAEGFSSFGILYGLGVAIGQWTAGEADYQRAVMLDEIKRGIVHGAGHPLGAGDL